MPRRAAAAGRTRNSNSASSDHEQQQQQQTQQQQQQQDGQRLHHQHNHDVLHDVDEAHVSASNGASSESSSSATAATVAAASVNLDHQWYKFDDGEVSEFKMDDEEMRNQCYGGDYTGEVYDNVMKRTAYKKQKRWWNAYILFYERQLKPGATDPSSSVLVAKAPSSASTPTPPPATTTTTVNNKMPPAILRSVYKKNIKFSHHRHHFSVEYFQFVRKLVQANLCLLQNGAPLVSFGLEQKRRKH